MNYFIYSKKISILVATACILTSSNLLSQSTAPNQKLSQFFENYYNENHKIDPLSATFDGENKYNDLLPAPDSKYLAELHNFRAKMLAELKKFDTKTLNEKDKISYLILKNRLENSLNSEQFHTEYMPVDQFNGIQLGIAILGSGSTLQPFKTTKDYDNWLKRCAAIPNYINVSIENMKKGVKTGIVIPKSTALKAIPQLENLSKNDSTSVFYGPIKNFPESFSKQDKVKYTTAFKKAIGGQVLPAYQKLLTYFKNDYLPKTRLTDGVNSLQTAMHFIKNLFLKALLRAKLLRKFTQSDLQKWKELRVK